MELSGHLTDLFNTAGQQSGIKQMRMQLGNSLIEFFFAGDPLAAALLPALKAEPTADTCQTPAYTIYAWEGGSSPAASIAELGASPDARQDHIIRLLNRDPLHCLFNPEGSIFAMLDTSLHVGFYHVPDSGALPDYEVCTPMRMLFHRICQALGMYFVHSAAIAWGGKGALLTGRSGAGKSTTALISLVNGLDFIADDYVCVTGLPDQFDVHRIFSGCKLMDDCLPCLRALERYIVPTNKTGGKNVLMLEPSAGSIIEKAPLRVIIRPMIARRSETVFEKMSPAMALAELAGSTMLQMPGSTAYMMGGLSGLCRGLPVFAMHMSEDAREISAALRRFLEEDRYE